MKGNYLGLKDTVREALDHFFAALYPRHFGAEEHFEEEEKKRLEFSLFKDSLLKAVKYFLDSEQAEGVFLKLEEKLPKIAALIGTDIQAAYEGDPAAMSTDEVILSYPAFPAISAYRLAHELYLLKVPVVPRMMTELEHSSTGIDIHPGASIGPYFFIDHGTGVVIGETTTIGEHVKLYQHVTLGAKSFAVEEDGSLVKGIKRHPDIGDNVVIYSGATVLGGKTRIGNGCVIGGSVWLTHSVEAGKMVLARAAVSGDLLLRDNLPDSLAEDAIQLSQLAAML